MNAKEVADSFHAKGFNCCESILLSMSMEYGFDLDESLVKIATGFGSGIGRSGCACGALVGAVMACGLKCGRTRPGESKEPAYAKAKAIHDAFKKKFGATCCRAIRGGDYGSEAQKKKCGEIVKFTAEMTSKILGKD